MPIGTRLRAMSGPRWLAFFAMILAAWLLLFFMSVPGDLRAAERLYGPEFWAAICTVTPDGAGFLKLVLMWVVMSAAMMAPTFLPAMATYDDISASTGSKRGFVELLLGYLLIWIGFSVLAAAAQLGLFLYGAVNPIGQSTLPWFSALLLAVAGGYQFARLKAACLSKCRAPMAFFLQHWSSAPWASLRMGVHLGVLCLGCCWALMLLAFVGGAMNLLWMGLATVIMIFEKLPEIGRYVTQPLGMVLLAAALLTAGRATGLI